MRRRIYMATGTLAIAVVVALVASNIAPDHKFGWGENIGWLNWRDANGTAEGVVVHETFLSGYVWSRRREAQTVGSCSISSPASHIRSMKARRNSLWSRPMQHECCARWMRGTAGRNAPSRKRTMERL